MELLVDEGHVAPGATLKVLDTSGRLMPSTRLARPLPGWSSSSTRLPVKSSAVQYRC